MRWFWKESDFSFAIVPGVYCAQRARLRNHTKAFDVEDGADTLCFRFDDSLDSAADSHLREVIHLQKVVKEKCGGAFQMDKP